MLHPATGEILALAIAPSVNPNVPNSFDPGRARNRVVTDTFEPGSLFKIVTATAAYEHGLVLPSTRFNAENGEYRVRVRGTSYRVIRDSHKYRALTFQEAVEHSSNIVMAKVSERIGAQLLYRTARDYGFGTPTGIEFPGEVGGKLKRPRDWSRTTLHTLAYGYEVSVTPLQIAAAYAAVADKGTLRKPFVVAQIRDSRGTILGGERPQVVRKVFQESTAELLTAALEGVVQRGTGSEVRTEGLRIAGKTGTARRVQEGRYLAGSYTASFAGFFPVDNPQVVCLVMIDNPRARGYYGGMTAAPVFRSIARRIVQTSPRFVSPPVVAAVDRTPSSVVVPDVRHLDAGIGSRVLADVGLKAEFFGRGRMIVRQSPAPGKRIEPGDVVSLVVSAEPQVGRSGNVLVPDVRGMSARRAINRLVAEDFDVHLRGSGVVREQQPPPGSQVPMGSRMNIVCEPRSITSARLY
jgi:cell division protein FtsI (penicillin-binding protein 3)